MSKNSTTPWIERTLAAVLGLAVACGLWWVLSGGDGVPASETPGAAAGPVEAIAGPPAEPARTGFPPIEVPASVLASWEAERAALASELGPAELEVIRTWSIANFVAASVQLGRFEGDPQESAQAHNDAVGRYLTARDPAEYRVLSWAAYERFVAGLGTLEVLEGSGDLRDALADLSNPAVQAHYEACGDFVTQAVRTGVLTEQGELRVSPELLAIIFRYRWFAGARAHRPLSELLPGAESLVFQRWRIEQATGIPETERLRYIEQLFREFPDFDGYTAEEARAIVQGVSEP